MIKSIVKVGLLLLVGVLGYNYFLGSPDEKAQSKEIIGKIGDVGKAGVGLLKGEINKFKDGKYDRALDKVGDALGNAKEKIKKGGSLLEKVNEWDNKKSEWAKKRDDLKEILAKKGDADVDEATQEAAKALTSEAKQLEEEGRELAKAIEADSK